MKQNYNARKGLELCFYGEIGMALGCLTVIGGLIGTIFTLFSLAGFVFRAQGMKKAVHDNRDFMRASRLLMVGIAVNAALFLISFYQKRYVYTSMLLEMNAILNILSNYMIIRSTMDMLEYNGRTELCHHGKTAWTLYWVMYMLFLVCVLSEIFTYWIGSTTVLILRIVGVLLAVFASFNYVRWLRRVYPVV